MSETVLQDFKDNGVLLIRLNRPQRKNAFNSEQWRAFGEALIAAQANPAVACVVLTGEGGNFCSGMDLNDFGGEGEGEEPAFYGAERAVVGFDKPLIGAANGVAVGGGATLLLHCDIVYVGSDLRMRFPFTSLGLVPEFASSYTLQASIGSRRAAELMYTSEWLDADKALHTGIVTQVFAPEKVLAQALEKAADIAQWPVSSLVATKRCLKLAHTQGIQAAMAIEREGMQKLAGGPENIEAVMAFMEKRKPDFSKFRQ